MKRSILILLAIMLASVPVFGLFTTTNCYSPTPDTLWVLPGQDIDLSFMCEAQEVNAMMLNIGHHGLNWNNLVFRSYSDFYDFWEEEGLFIYQLEEGWWRAAWLSDAETSWTDSWYNSLRKPVVQIIVPYSAIVCSTSYISWNGQINWGAAAGYWENTLSDCGIVAIRWHNRPRGDINNDGVVDDADTALMLAAVNGFVGTTFQGYFYTAELNYSAGFIAIPWMGSINPYLKHLWVVDHNNPLVQNLHIGELFTDDGGYNQLTPVIAGQTITIPQSGDNLYALEGIYPDGTPWTSSVLFDGSNLLRFNQGSEVPLVEPLSRQPVVFIMPDGVQYRQAISRLTGSINTAAEDAATPVTPVSVNCYPNPFGGSTTIKSTGVTPTKIGVFNIKGQVVKTLANDSKTQSIDWDGRDNRNQQVPAGIYFIKAASQNQAMTTKVIKIQ